MGYELWSLDTRNIVGGYESEDAALVVVNDALNAHGREAVSDLALAYEDRRGRTRLIAKGDDLIARAQAATTPTPPSLGVRRTGKIASIGAMRSAARSGAWAVKLAANKTLARTVTGKAGAPVPPGHHATKHKQGGQVKARKDSD